MLLAVVCLTAIFPLKINVKIPSFLDLRFFFLFQIIPFYKCPADILWLAGDDDHNFDSAKYARLAAKLVNFVQTLSSPKFDRKIMVNLFVLILIWNFFFKNIYSEWYPFFYFLKISVFNTKRY